MGLLVKQVMYSEPRVLLASSTLAEAAAIYLCGEATCAPVMDEDGKVVGIITVAELIKALQEGKSFNTPVTEVMERNLVSIQEDVPFEAVADLPLERLLVVNREQKLTGILTRIRLIKQVYHALQETENQLRAVLEAAPNGILAADEQGVITHVNIAASKMLGLSREEVLGKTIGEVLPTFDYKEVLHEGSTIIGRQIILGNITIVLTANPIIYQGRIIGMVISLQDISDLQAMYNELEAIRALNQELTDVIESSYDGIIVINNYGKVLRVNSSYERIFGTSAAKLLGQDLTETDGYCRQIWEEILASVIQEGRAISRKLSTPEGKEVLITGNPVLTEEGKIIRVVINVRDMTELTRLQAELEQNREETARLSRELRQLRARLLNEEGVIFKDEQMLRIVEQALLVARVDSTVLITGESGVGKEVIAKIIHRNSRREKGPFIQVNCGAIPENLLESELFGYEGGAFTGANREGKIGLLELANGGTLLLDEIAELPLSLQVKLLRFLQDQQILRVGGRRPVKLDVRIIAATNRDLKELVKAKAFREDLYYRLNVVPLEIPPLRQRRVDIAPLAHLFLQKFNRKYGLTKKLHQEVFLALESYYWPGNVRELENLIERLVVTTQEDIITLKHLPPHILGSNSSGNFSFIVHDIIPLKDATEMVEKTLISRALECCGSLRKAGRELGITHSTLLRKARQYGLLTNNK